MSYSLTLHAQDDIDEVADNIEDVDEADAWVDAIHDALKDLGQSPGLGHRRSDITDHDVLFWSFRKRWAVIYRADTPITVIRIVPWAKVSTRFWFGAGW